MFDIYDPLPKHFVETCCPLRRKSASLFPLQIKLPVCLDTEAAVDGSINNFIQWLYQHLVVRDLFEALPTLTENNLGPNTVAGNWPAQQEAVEEELPYPVEALLTLLAAGPCQLTTLQVMKEHFLSA